MDEQEEMKPDIYFWIKTFLTEQNETVNEYETDDYGWLNDHSDGC